MAMTEIFGHLELLDDTGDIEFIETNQAVRWTGTENYKRVLDGLGAEADNRIW